MKAVMRPLFLATLALATLSCAQAVFGAIDTAVVQLTTVIAEGRGNPRKANGILLPLGKDVYVVTVGHTFYLGSLSAQLITGTGERVTAYLEKNFYDPSLTGN